jgi:hypothetical protein
MVGLDDIDSYGEPNDLPPDEPGPREPRGEPSGENDEFIVWAFEAERSETVPDTFVVLKDPEPLDFRMWMFTGEGEKARFSMRSSHRYGPEEETPPDEECCEVLVDGQSLSEEHCPEGVTELVEGLVDAEVGFPSGPSSGHGGPINY